MERKGRGWKARRKKEREKSATKRAREGEKRSRERERRKGECVREKEEHKPNNEKLSADCRDVTLGVLAVDSAEDVDVAPVDELLEVLALLLREARGAAERTRTNGTEENDGWSICSTHG